MSARLEPLLEVADAQVRLVEGHHALIGAFQPCQDAQQGGLAAAVGTDQANPLSRVEAEGDIVEDGVDIVRLADVMGSKHKKTPVAK